MELNDINNGDIINTVQVVSDMYYKEIGKYKKKRKYRKIKCLLCGNITEARELALKHGTPEECKIAVEKQHPKKPINPDDDYGTFKCPNCNGLIFTEDRFETHKYCLLCGQALDWSDK